MRSDLCLCLLLLCSATAQVKDGQITYHTEQQRAYRPNPQFLQRHVRPRGNPLPRPLPYPGDLTAFLGSRDQKLSSTTHLSRKATTFGMPDYVQNPVSRSSSDHQNQPANENSGRQAVGLGPVPTSTSGLPAFSAPEGARTRFTDTKAEYSFDGAGFLQGQSFLANKPSSESVESANRQHEASNKRPSYPDGPVGAVVPPPPPQPPLIATEERRQQALMEPVNPNQHHVNVPPPPQGHGIPIPMPAGSVVMHHFIANNGIPIGGYAGHVMMNGGHPHVAVAHNPGFNYRYKRNSDQERRKSVRIKVFRSVLNNNAIPQHKNTSTKLERTDRSDHQTAESEFVHFGSFPFFGGNDEASRNQQYGVYSMDDREESRGNHFHGRSGPGIYSAEEQGGYGYGALGSGNFEIVRGGIFGDHHAAANNVPVINGGRGRGGGGYGSDDSYSYDDEDEPVLGFQGFNNFGALQNVLGSRKRLSVSHPPSHDGAASQLIESTAVLEATE